MNDYYAPYEDASQVGRYSLSERMRVMPAVIVMGARQTGKSNLAEQLVPGTRREHSIYKELKPRFLPRIRPPAFDAPIDIFGGWRYEKRDFIGRVRVEGPRWPLS
jgi:hypothetical protein